MGIQIMKKAIMRMMVKKELDLEAWYGFSGGTVKYSADSCNIHTYRG